MLIKILYPEIVQGVSCYYALVKYLTILTINTVFSPRLKIEKPLKMGYLFKSANANTFTVKYFCVVFFH